MKVMFILGKVPWDLCVELRHDMRRRGEKGYMVAQGIPAKRSEHKFYRALADGASYIELVRAQPEALWPACYYRLMVDFAKPGNELIVVAEARPQNVPRTKHWDWARNLLAGKGVRWYAVEAADSPAGFKLVDEGIV